MASWRVALVTLGLFLCLFPVQAHFIDCIPKIARAAKLRGSWYRPEGAKQGQALERALLRYKSDGTRVTHLNAYEVTGFNGGYLFSTGEWNAAKNGEPRGVFESREHFWVLFDQAVHEELTFRIGTARPFRPVRAGFSEGSATPRSHNVDYRDRSRGQI